MRWHRLGTCWLGSSSAEKDLAELRDMFIFLYSTLISLYTEYHVQFLFPHPIYKRDDKLA